LILVHKKKRKEGKDFPGNRTQKALLDELGGDFGVLGCAKQRRAAGRKLKRNQR